MDSSQTDELVPFEEDDRPELDALVARHSRGARFMLKVLGGWLIVSIAAAGLASAFTAHLGPVGGITGSVLAFMILIYFVTRRRLAKLKRDIASGKKLRIEAVIDEKEVTGSGGEVSALQFFLHLKGLRFWVDARTHEIVAKGDRVRLEYLPVSELVLRMTKL